MPAKLRVEIKECHLARGLLIWLLSALVTGFVMASAFLEKYPTGCQGEFIVWVLNNDNIILVLFPILLLAVTSSGQTQAFRYPVLIRYRNRNEFFCIKIAVRTGFVLLCLSAFVGMLFFIRRGMPVEIKHAFIVSEDFAGIMVRQCLNIFCFWSAMLLLHEILQSIVSNAMLDLAVTTFVPLGNYYILAKRVLVQALEWTPWGKISYKIEEIVEEPTEVPTEYVEKLGRYQFYWWYWLAVIFFLLCLAKALHGKKDFVFEKNHDIR